jgi:hypothetical protein
MPEPIEIEQSYLVPSHLRVQESVGPFPARVVLPLFLNLLPGIPLGVNAWHATGGLLAPAIAAGLVRRSWPRRLRSPATPQRPVHLSRCRFRQRLRPSQPFLVARLTLAPPC